MMRFALLAGAVLVCAAVSHAQQQSEDERAIRDLIARYDAGEPAVRTDDAIVWSGQFKRPTIGAQTGEPVAPERQPSARVPGAVSTRVLGSRRRVTTPLRIEIAKSQDLAYEFSDSELRFDLANGERETVRSSVLRVWKKDGGQWKNVAMFARPHDQDAAQPDSK